MDVIVFLGNVVAGRAGVHVDVADQPDILQTLQRTVDGGQRDIGSAVTHGTPDALGGGMTQTVCGHQNGITLGGDPHTRGTDPTVPPVDGGLIRRGRH